MNVPNHEKKTFRDMSDAEKLAIINAKLSGTCQVFHGEWYESLTDDNVCLNSAYRTRPRQLAIPWEHIKPEYKWAAMDEDCGMFVFSAKPVIDKFDPIWTHADGCAAISALNNIDTTGIDWRDSLTARPEGV